MEAVETVTPENKVAATLAQTISFANLDIIESMDVSSNWVITEIPKEQQPQGKSEIIDNSDVNFLPMSPTISEVLSTVEGNEFLIREQPKESYLQRVKNVIKPTFLPPPESQFLRIWRSRKEVGRPNIPRPHLLNLHTKGNRSKNHSENCPFPHSLQDKRLKLPQSILGEIDRLTNVVFSWTPV